MIPQRNKIALFLNVVFIFAILFTLSVPMTNLVQGENKAMLKTQDQINYDDPSFDEKYYYDGDDLGVTISATQVLFRLWAPTASGVSVLLFQSGDLFEENPKTVKMVADRNGTWIATTSLDVIGQYYLYEIDLPAGTKRSVDPYATAVGVNGKRGQIIDLKTTNPDGFKEQERPKSVPLSQTILYEIHVRDLSMSENSGIKNKGKFLGFTETGTTNSHGASTGVDHIKQLGVTHVHLLPSFDFKTIDESSDKPTFNWGYDPQNYNVPEGSYATDPYNGTVRIHEMKQMVQGLHKQDLRVVMDVVYNHTFSAEQSPFQLTVPDYFYRLKADGSFSDGSACGNEVASERKMVRKYIIDSVTYWAKEYHIDGFRFDLMGLHDIETMNEIRLALDEINPDIVMYGEGWTGGTTPLSESQQALKKNALQLHERIAVFSDDIRDGLKGSVFEPKEKGFATGSIGRKMDVQFGIVGAIAHDQIDINKVSYSDVFWANSPTQSVNYVSAHDNLSLWDKLTVSNPNATVQELEQMNRLSAAVVITSQGIPFFQAGEEMARSKNGDENSYRSSDAVNQIDWDRKTEFSGLVDYYTGLIAFRNQFPALFMEDAQEVRERLTFAETPNELIAYTIDQPAGGYQKFLFLFHGGANEITLNLNDSVWDILVDAEHAGSSALYQIDDGVVRLDGQSALILASKQPKAEAVALSVVEPIKNSADNLPVEAEVVQTKRNLFIPLLSIGVAVVAGAFGFWLFRRRRGKH